MIPMYYAMVDRLARITTSGRRIRELDGLRFIAIATVFVQHVYEVVMDHCPPGKLPRSDLLATLVRDWRIGVELFFLISGFILAAPFAAQHMLGGRAVSLKQYYWRRVTRLEPPYLLTLLLWYVVLVFYWHQSARQLLPHLLASALYMHNVVYRGFSTINSVAWSLEIEVQFYVLAPLLACVFLIRPMWLRRGVIILAAVALAQFMKVLHHFAPSVANLGGVGGTLLNYLPLFLMGFLLADMFLVDWNQQPRPTLWGDVVAIPGWLLILPLYFEQTAFFHFRPIAPTMFPFLLLVLCWASFRSVYTRRFLASSFIMTVGGMCYSFYLLHFPLLHILGNYAVVPLGVNHIGFNTLLYSLIWGIPTLGATIIFFMLVEKPCMRKDWPQRMLARFTGRPIPRDVPPPPSAAAPAKAILDVPANSTSPLL
jgi:peptidoglycan/LPS O-acetylase OafA/YrhL